MSFFTYCGERISYEVCGSGEPLVLLHGNTVSSRFFAPIIPQLSGKYRVITLDFLGCGQSDRMEKWPTDLWYEWSRQVTALCKELKLEKIKLIGCSGGALAAINVALENPELVEAVAADSFEGLEAKSDITEQIRMGREFAKQNTDFCAMLSAMHGDDWENVLNADTEAVVQHAKTVGTFCHKKIEELQTNLMLTGSAEDEMFPRGHYEELFGTICAKTPMARSHIFEHGGHPAMMSNMAEFIALCDEFFK